jgi:hypothetical protein
MSASSVMIEDDFWVCCLLGLLVADAELAPHLVLKGGTSQTKVHGVIENAQYALRHQLVPAQGGRILLPILLPEAGKRKWASSS